MSSYGHGGARKSLSSYTGEPDNPFAFAAQLLARQAGNVKHPVDWAKNRAQIHLWSKQRQIADDVVKHRKVCVRAGNGVGKSMLASTLAAWWVDTHPAEQTVVVTTAPTYDQVHGVVWESIRAIHRRANLPGEVQMRDRWVIDGVEVGIGRRPADHSDSAFQGRHRKYVLVILDEAGGLPEWLFEAAERITTGSECRILAIGNPTNPSSYFEQINRPDSGWKVHKISVLESPNFTNEKYDLDEDALAALTQPSWVEARRQFIGEQSPLWQSTILGEFPTLDDSSVIPLPWVLEANERWREWDEAGRPLPDARRIISADIARFGRDATVFCERVGDYIIGFEKFKNYDTERTADTLMSRLDPRKDWGVIDAVGLGAGVVDKLARKHYAVKSFNAGSRTSVTDSTGNIGFPNIRSAAWWRLREALDPMRGSTLCLPPDETLSGDLIAPRFTQLAGAKIAVEPKVDTKKRLGRSTDYADALVGAMWFGSHVRYDNDDPYASSFHYTDNPSKFIDSSFAWDEREEASLW